MIDGALHVGPIVAEIARVRSAQTLPERAESTPTPRNHPEHKLLKVLQGLVNIGVPGDFDPLISTWVPVT